MDKIPWIPEELIKEWEKERSKLLISSLVLLGLGVLAFLSSLYSLMNQTHWFLVSSILLVSGIFTLLGLRQLKTTMEHRIHGKDLLQKQEAAISNESLLLLAEIELELENPLE